MSRLTDREIDVLVDYARTASIKETARNLGITVSTVKQHMQSARRRYDAVSTMELFARLGWVRVPIKGEREFSRLRARLVALRDEVDALLGRFRLTVPFAQAGWGTVA